MGGAAFAQGEAGFGAFGRPGMIDMPIGQAASDATFALAYSQSEGFTRNSIFFQFAPWWGVTLRYGGNGLENADGIRPNYDRNLDLVFTPFSETHYRPAISIGLQDLLGTGGYAGEFIVASKTFAQGKITATAGMGWGRLASRGGFENPLGAISPDLRTRGRRDVGLGGKPAFDQWFRGDAALFGGVQYRPTPRLTLTAEYSSDDYSYKNAWRTFTAKSPINYGISYQISSGVHTQLSYIQGSDLVFGVFLRSNIGRSPYPGSREKAPSYVIPRSKAAALPLNAIEERLAEIFAQTGLRLDSARIDGQIMRISFENLAYDFEAQAFGRAARWMTHVAPPQVTAFELTATASGMPVAVWTVNRQDLENNEHTLTGAEDLRRDSTLAGAGPRANIPALPYKPDFIWGIGPYMQVTLFDPDEPRRADFGLAANARLQLAPNVFVSTSLMQFVAGNRAAGRGSNSVLPIVRSDQVNYDQNKDLRIENLYVSAHQRLAPNVYGRASLGYFEQMYAGISGEVLWKPFDKNWSLGAEVNHVIKRDYAGGFDFQDYEITTGHVSAQYTFDTGYFGRIDAGRYLAGDVGATFTVGRSFANGWRLSAFATLTDVPFEDFGEGSFDKGIRFEIPAAQLLGNATRYNYDIGINSINRDGGRRVEVPGRLSKVLDGYSAREIDQSWSRVFR